jgi:hypothetical protein
MRLRKKRKKSVISNIVASGESRRDVGIPASECETDGVSHGCDVSLNLILNKNTVIFLAQESRRLALSTGIECTIANVIEVLAENHRQHIINLLNLDNDQEKEWLTHWIHNMEE